MTMLFIMPWNTAYSANTVSHISSVSVIVLASFIESSKIAIVALTSHVDLSIVFTSKIAIFYKNIAMTCGIIFGIDFQCNFDFANLSLCHCRAYCGILPLLKPLELLFHLPESGLLICCFRFALAMAIFGAVFG